ncbi:MAG: Zn-dependent oligopeptidase [Candidatus Sungbacteria bacterium]|nr:Zn-dependent oligopeptidase [Candidatus Sungbacteria bacterium]
MKTISYKPKDFNWTRWKKADMHAAAEAAMAGVKSAKDAIKRIAAQDRTFANTIWPYERAMREVGTLQCKLHLLASVALQKDTRTAAHSTVERIHAKLVGLLYDAGLYRAFKEYAARSEKLAPDAERLVAFLIRDYRRMGMDLAAAKRAEVKKNGKLLNKLTLAFQKNLNEYHDEIRVDRKELAGLPESYISGLARDSKGKYMVTLKYPDLHPFLRHAQDEARRKELIEKYLRHGGIQNVAILQKALKLRERNAKLLGYKTHAHFVLEVKMAKTPERVLEFINGLVAHTRSAAKKEVTELTERKRKETGDTKTKLEFHDVSFYAELVRQQKFSLDSEKVREYFPLEFVLAAMFAVYAKLLSVTFKKLSGFKLWSPDVVLYEVADAKGSRLGYFGLDMYPRPGKYGHMAAFNTVAGSAADFTIRQSVERIAPVCFLVGNFPKPGKNRPSLLSHGEVDTLFHEFGHIMHFTLGNPRFASQNSFAVAGDFVEMPSQMLENWTWDRKILKKISRHYRTGKPLPDSMIDGMLAARNFLEAYGVTRQMVLASYDMALHLKPPKTAAENSTLMMKLNKKMLGIEMPKNSMFGAGFGHLMGEYDAGYYGYAWSKVYAADLFTRFEKEGIMSSRAGKDYRNLLAKAATQDEMKMITAFLGRKPNDKAFLKQLRQS